jgi:RNA polymerase sigma-70 factor (ECF subfamily)
MPAGAIPADTSEAGTGVGPVADAELLHTFVARSDRRAAEAAFAELVRRHGPVVMGVCRRVLRDSADADDAFQATFLVLAMRARSIREPHLLGNWLHGVAARAAGAARRDARRRAAREGRLMSFLRTRRARAAVDDAARAEWSQVLDEAICRLPGDQRKAVVACYVEGKTRREAAQRFGWPEGTVATRLRQARETLRARLARKGFGVSAATVAAGLPALAAPVVPPVALSQATAAAAALLAQGKAAASPTVSAKAITLAKGVSKAMSITTMKVLSAVILSTGLALGVASAATRWQGPAAPAASPRAAAGAVASRTLAAAAPAADEPSEADLKENARRMRSIGLALQYYSKDHEGNFPPDLGATLKHMKSEVAPDATPEARARLYLSRADEKRVKVPTDPDADWVKQKSSITYLAGEGVSMSKVGGDVVVAHEKKAAGQGGQVTLLFGDAHVEQVSGDEAKRMIKESKEKLAALR